MKAKGLILLLVVAVLLIGGCATIRQTERVAQGTALGTGFGYLVGGGHGAVIGGLLGGAVGGIFGTAEVDASPELRQPDPHYWYSPGYYSDRQGYYEDRHQRHYPRGHDHDFGRAFRGYHH